MDCTLESVRVHMHFAVRASGPAASKLAPAWFYAIIPYRLSVGLTSTLLPLFVVQVIGGTVADVGVVAALGPLVGVPAAVFWGNLSDRQRRRRPFLILGFLGYAVSTILLGLTSSVGEVILVSMTGALLSTAIEPVASALIVDQLPEGAWAEAFGRYNRIGGWSLVTGLGAGMLWLSVSPTWWDVAASMRGLFLFAGTTSALSLVLVLRFLREPAVVRRRRPFRRAFAGHLVVAVVERALHSPNRLLYHVLRPTSLSDLRAHATGSLGRYYLATLLLFFTMALGFVPFPIFLTDVLDATSTQVFLVFLIKAATDATFYVPMGRLVRRRSGVELLSLASAVRVGILGAYALVALLWPGPHSLVAVSLIFMLTGVTWAAIAVAGTTAVAVFAQKGLEGRAMGLYNAVLGLGWVSGSLAGGWCAATFGYGASFGSAAILMAMMVIWFWRLRMRMPNQA